MPCHAWKCVPTAISDDADISEVLGCHFLWKMSSQWGFQKLLQGLVPHELIAYLSVFDLFLTLWIMAISKWCKPDNLESHNSLKLTSTVIWSLWLNFVECKSFLESNYPDILALCEANLDDSITFLSLFLDVTRMSVSTVSFLTQLDSGIPYQQNASLWPMIWMAISLELTDTF